VVSLGQCFSGSGDWDYAETEEIRGNHVVVADADQGIKPAIEAIFALYGGVTIRLFKSRF
jgi:hypothetical protein